VKNTIQGGKNTGSQIMAVQELEKQPFIPKIKKQLLALNHCRQQLVFKIR